MRAFSRQRKCEIMCTSFMTLWQITSIGLCDVETETLKQIYDGADKVKPSSITVRFNSSLLSLSLL